MKLLSKIKENLFSIFQTALIVLLVVLVIVFVGVLSFEYVETHTSKLLDLSSKNETLKFLGIGMGGVLVALQALMSYKRAKAMEKTAEAQADAAKAQADAVSKTEQGQRQDRLKNAIEHLGHESDSVRLGGAYELFHLAEDTEDLRQTVLDILCAHIRQTTGEDNYRETHKSKPSEEIQSLLTLLFVQKPEVFKGCHINLQGSWLNGADLRSARLKGAVLTEAHLQEADLGWSHLQGAKLEKAQLQGASLKEAQLQGTNLHEACLQGANLDKTQLQGAKSEWTSPATSFGAGDHIKMQVGRETELASVIFAGGLSQEDVESLVKELSNGTAMILREKLKSHIGKPASHAIPENCDVVTGTYTQEEAKQWIAG